MFQRFEKIIKPDKLRKKIRLDKTSVRVKESNDRIIKDIISGADKRFLIVCGPCGADNADAVLEFCLKLKELSLKVNDKIFLVPRLYTAKARSAGDGYLGMMFQPDDEKVEIEKGIIATRKMLANCISRTGLPIADEFLYMEQLEYNSDLVSYYFLGARQSNTPLYRNIASGLECAVGVKNDLSGNLANLAGSLHAVKTRKDFIFRNGQISTVGNAYSHAVLRGYSNARGEFFSNDDQESIDELRKHCDDLGVPCEFVMIDCSHANSKKQAKNQIDNALNAVNKDGVRGLMLESYLHGGCAKNEYGVSKIDECLDWESTQELILKLYDLLPAAEGKASDAENQQ